VEIDHAPEFTISSQQKKDFPEGTAQVAFEKSLEFKPFQLPYSLQSK